MVLTCKACKTKYVKGRKTISFHRFPADPIQRKLWINALNRENFEPGESAALCSKHFTEDCFGYIRLDGFRALKRGSVPTIFFEEEVNDNSSDDSSTSDSSSRHSSSSNSSSSDSSSFENFIWHPVVNIAVSHDQLYTPSSGHISKLNEMLERTRKKLKMSYQQQRRYKKKILAVKEVILMLKKKGLISSNVSDILNNAVHGFSLDEEIENVLSTDTSLQKEDSSCERSYPYVKEEGIN